MRLRNDSGYPLNSGDLGRQIPHDEEFEHDEYITGCTWLDRPEPEPEDDGADENGPPGDDKSATQDTGSDSGDGKPAKTPRSRAASKGDQA